MKTPSCEPKPKSMTRRTAIGMASIAIAVMTSEMPASASGRRCFVT
jgi:hypothetical protein